MFSDDLVPVLGPTPGPGLRFRQGTILTWNADTGSNTIDIGGATLTNVPILNTGEAITLKPGHIVGLLAIQGSFWILGRITVPGESDFASASVEFHTGIGAEVGFGLTTTAAAIVSCEIPVPSWADQALVAVTLDVSLHNTRASADFAFADTVVEGDTVGPMTRAGFAANGDAGAGDWGCLSSSYNVFVFGPFGDTIQVDGRVFTNGAAWSADAFNSAYLSAHAIYRSTV